MNDSNPLHVATLLQRAEAELVKWAHPDPYIAPTAPGGSKYQRNVPPHPSFTFHEYPSEEHGPADTIDSDIK